MEKMTKEQILNEWQKESRAANDCICEILSSYMDFVLYCMVPHPKQDNVERLVEIHNEYVKVKNHYKCEMCGKTGMLHVHHPTYDFHGRELQNINKLKCLCDSCHKIFHNKDNQRG